MVSLAAWKDLRKQWVSARDAVQPKIGAGAVKGVSLGDAIDGVFKASPKGYKAVGKAAAKLKKDVDTYKKGIKTKHAVILPWLTSHIETPTGTLVTDVADDLKLIGS